MEFQKRVLIKLKSFQQVIGNSPPTVKHVCLPKYKSNFVWFWVPTWFFFESEQCHGLQKGHIARAKLPCCRVATLDSILNLIFYPEFDFDFLNCYLGQWFILVPSLPKGDQISKLFWLLSHLKKKAIQSRSHQLFQLLRLKSWWTRISCLFWRWGKMKIPS